MTKFKTANDILYTKLSDDAKEVLFDLESNLLRDVNSVEASVDLGEFNVSIFDIEVLMLLILSLGYNYIGINRGILTISLNKHTEEHYDR